jgi:hypothetical protein
MRRGPRGWIIRQMSGGGTARSLVAVAAFALVVAPGAAGGSSPLDGRWTWTWTRSELLGPGAKGCEAAAYVPHDLGSWTITFANGRYAARVLRTGEVIHGSFSVDRDVLTFVPHRRHEGMPAWRPARIRFSVYRDRVTFTDLPGRLCPLHLFTLEPWTRAPSG